MRPASSLRARQVDKGGKGLRLGPEVSEQLRADRGGGAHVQTPGGWELQREGAAGTVLCRDQSWEFTAFLGAERGRE